MATKTGVMQSLYFDTYYADWNIIKNFKTTYPNVPCCAVINPNSGVGDQRYDWYAEDIKELQAAGIKIFGYIWVNWAARDINEAYDEIEKYVFWYDVDGIFFDEFPVTEGALQYVTDLGVYGKKYCLYCVGNPGTNMPVSYIGKMDNFMIYETEGLPDLSWVPSTYPNKDKKHFSTTAYNVTSLNGSQVSNIAQYVGWMYLTEDVQPNPYDSFSTHLTLMFQILNA